MDGFFASTGLLLSTSLCVVRGVLPVVDGLLPFTTALPDVGFSSSETTGLSGVPEVLEPPSPRGNPPVFGVPPLASPRRGSG